MGPSFDRGVEGSLNALVIVPHQSRRNFRQKIGYFSEVVRHVGLGVEAHWGINLPVRFRAA